MTTSIYDRVTQSVDQFSASTVNRKLSAVLWWFPELLVISGSGTVAGLIAAVFGSVLATVLACLPGLGAGLRIAASEWLSRERNRLAHVAAQQAAAPPEQPAETEDNAEGVPDRLVTLEVLR